MASADKGTADTVGPVRRDDQAGPPIIAAEGVSKRFATNQVLTRVSLAVCAREVVCIVGPSGSGKTTLLRCLALLEEPSEGRVMMNGTVIS
jgi:ABC-type Fe3+/spermidine/putrescine transport system ATPase subunit